MVRHRSQVDRREVDRRPLPASPRSSQCNWISLCRRQDVRSRKDWRTKRRHQPECLSLWEVHRGPPKTTSFENPAGMEKPRDEELTLQPPWVLFDFTQICSLVMSASVSRAQYLLSRASRWYPTWSLSDTSWPFWKKKSTLTPAEMSDAGNSLRSRFPAVPTQRRPPDLRCRRTFRCKESPDLRFRWSPVRCPIESGKCHFSMDSRNYSRSG